MRSSPSSTNREHLLVMSGGAPLDEVDGYSVTLVDHDNTMTLQLTSNVRGMHVLEDTQADRDSGIVGPDADNSTTGRSCLTTFLAVCFSWSVYLVCLSVLSVNSTNQRAAFDAYTGSCSPQIAVCYFQCVISCCIGSIISCVLSSPAVCNKLMA